MAHEDLRIIVPFAPGGPADGSARVLAEAMAPALGQSIIVENKTGAGGAIGVTAAAQSNDGHTLLMGSTSMVVTPHLVPNLQYDVIRDFEPVGMVSAQPLVLVVPASHRCAASGLIAAAKAKPGEADRGQQRQRHARAPDRRVVRSRDRCVADERAVPRRKRADARPAGRQRVEWVSSTCRSRFRSPRRQAARAGRDGAEPRTELPGVQTFRALGIAEMEVEGWAALLAARGVPDEGRARLETVLSKALASGRCASASPSSASRRWSRTKRRQRRTSESEGDRWGQCRSQPRDQGRVKPSLLKIS